MDLPVTTRKGCVIQTVKDTGVKGWRELHQCGQHQRERQNPSDSRRSLVSSNQQAPLGCCPGSTSHSGHCVVTSDQRATLLLQGGLCDTGPQRLVRLVTVAGQVGWFQFAVMCVDGMNT